DAPGALLPAPARVAGLPLGALRAAPGARPVPPRRADAPVARPAVAARAGGVRHRPRPGRRRTGRPRHASDGVGRRCAGGDVRARPAHELRRPGAPAGGLRRRRRQVGRDGSAPRLARRRAVQHRQARRRRRRRGRAHRARGPPRAAVERRAARQEPRAAEAAHLMAVRMRLLLAFLYTVLPVFTGRLMVLQLVRSEEYAHKSIQNSLAQQRITPLRGRILARDGTVLADDRVAHDLMYRGGPAPEWERIKALLGVDHDLRPPDRNKPEEVMNGAVAVWNIPDELVAAVEERVAGSPSLYLRQRIERTYPTNLAAQVVGYTQQADPIRNPGYSVNDLV